MKEISILFILFLIYSFLGWCMEVCVALHDEKKLINRGFLIGPICPIYGVGCLLMIFLLNRYLEDPLVLFVMAVLLCSFLEYFTGYLMEKLFKARWWDYSHKKFNINGRICLDNLIAFGILGLLVMYVLNPFFIGILKMVNGNILLIFSVIMVTTLIVDLSISFKIISGFKNITKSLKKDNTEFIKYLEKNKNFANDYEVLVALCNQNPDFIRSSYFRERKKAIIKTYILNIKNGKLLQNADNLTVVGSPYAMLLYAATGDENSVDTDDTFFAEKDTIQCFTQKFKNDEYLAFFRSPFNSKNNLTYLHNVYHKNFEKYFNLGCQCIAINMIGTDAQDRSNGMDMDSDFGYTTNQADIVAHAKYCYKHYPTIVNNIPKEKNVYDNTLNDYATMFVDLVDGMSGNNILVARKEDERTKLFEKPIEEMELSVRSYNCLKRAGIDTVGDLAKKTRAEMLKVRNMGAKSMEEVIKKLEDYGIILEGGEY